MHLESERSSDRSLPHLHSSPSGTFESVPPEGNQAVYTPHWHSVLLSHISCNLCIIIPYQLRIQEWSKAHLLVQLAMQV